MEQSMPPVPRKLSLLHAQRGTAAKRGTAATLTPADHAQQYFGCDQIVSFRSNPNLYTFFQLMCCDTNTHVQDRNIQYDARKYILQLATLHDKNYDSNDSDDPDDPNVDEETDSD